MISSEGTLELRRCTGGEIREGSGREWPAGEVLLAAETGPHTTRYLLAIPEATLAGSALTAFLDRVAPFGCPPPPSLIRAYGLPDLPYPSVLIREHEGAPADVSDAYRRFVGRARPQWLAALQDTGRGLCPALAWEAGPARRFRDPEEWDETLTRAGVVLAGVADAYLGRGLLLLAQPDLAASWQDMMSLGGATKARRMTGREFPVWVDLPAHQPALLASPLLLRAEQLLARR